MKDEEFLSQVPLFHSLSEEAMKGLLANIRKIRFKKGEALFKKGMEGDSLFIIKRGKVKIVIGSEDGEEIILAIFSVGDFFGEMSLLDGMPRSADAVAIEDTEVMMLNRREFINFLIGNEQAIRSILQSLSMRLRKTDDMLEDTCFLNISERVRKKLLELAESYGIEEKKSILIDLDITQRELAGMVGATRESVNKSLRILREKGIISTEGGRIRIHNLSLLRKRHS
ncbi:MAG TPA: Crp/Fnr family transcriptional regulator [Desulfobacteraceae bacterium]|nr:Crp/Fnr family transcriptional regulator [Desulfobacteraceae bacterium]